MIVPRRAPVRSRAVSPASGTVLPLEDLVAERIASAPQGLIEIVGPPGSGKTVALEHLADVFAANPNVGFLECLHEPPNRAMATRLRDWVVFTIQAPYYQTPERNQLRLAPWGQDECIEYLLAEHKDACAGVMSRLRAAGDAAFVGGNAVLWCIVLDEMAADPGVTSARQALARFLDGELTNPRLSTAAAACSIAALVHGECPPELLREKVERLPDGAEAVQLLRHRPLQLLIATQQIVHDVISTSTRDYFRLRFPRDLIECTAKALANQPKAIAKLQTWFAKPELQANAASILLACDAGWRPAAVWKDCRLTGAYLAGARWPGIAMRQGKLCETDLAGADLRQADLSGSRADRVNLVGADLREAVLIAFQAVGAEMARARLEDADAREAVFRGADLEQARFDGADLGEADFAESNLSEASFRGATMVNAKLIGAKLTGADFTAADLSGAHLVEVKLSEATFTGAVFVEAGLVGANLEGMDLPEADFSRAILTGALLTGSSMPRARFDDARLDNAGLAEVDWQGVSLRGADLRGASFHLGTTRSGLVGSPIACEGSRTGFYTDDYTEQDFKAPEQIRKANLCHADLRGADITDVDFYLVDLRHAKYDPEQEEHLRRCGAILHARAGEEIE